MASNSTTPLLVLTSMDADRSANRALLAKGCASSLMRNLFSGDLLIVRNSLEPVFRVDRKRLDEKAITLPTETDPLSRFQTDLRALSEHLETLEIAPRQWVLIASAASVALRNIDHLLPPDAAGPFAPPQIEFYWNRTTCGSGKQDLATPGFWAVRGEHLSMVLAHWKDALQHGQFSSNEEIWTRVVRELPLKKRHFEHGEVIAPLISAIDWELVTKAAFITLPSWPDQEARKFLQALYLGTVFADDTGFFFHILDA